MKVSKTILPIIVISQFCCTSLWFAGNAVMQNLLVDFQLDQSALGHLSSAVQFGFISGTLIFAILSIADRFSPSKVFLLSALFGALLNLGLILESNTLSSLVFFRFGTGFFLAGIYPIGMKIASDYFEKGLGKSLGFLVGALVLGTAFPHLLKGLIESSSWKFILIGTSCLAMLGGIFVISFVPNGPFRKPSQKLDFSAFFKVFKNREFRTAAFGYFGHMWELYAFWTFVPILLSTYNSIHNEASLNVPLLSFSIIGIGSIASVMAGYFSQLFGSKKTAFFALLLSCLCCLASPLIFLLECTSFVLVFLLFWGMVVVADSPLFSALVANSAPAKWKGTALTIVTCIGFTITIFSIQLLSFLWKSINPFFIYTILSLGPILSLLNYFRSKESNS